jgi:hypothetical protein
MRVVSNQSKAEMERREAQKKLSHALRQLTANLLRITNGAGHPQDLAKQLAECTAAIDAYDDVHELPSEYIIQSMLDHKAARHDGIAETERERALSQIRKGALQMVAAMLLDQGAQQRRGEKDIYAGIRLMNEVRS